jgi:hypothetical protein
MKNNVNILAANASNLQMATLRTLCQLYDWKYDTIYKKWKRGEFVPGYRDPAGRGIRFNLRDVEAWAHQSPVPIETPSLTLNQI